MSVKVNSWKTNHMFILSAVCQQRTVIYSTCTAVYADNMTQTE